MSKDKKNEFVLSERFSASLLDWVLNNEKCGGLAFVRSQKVYKILAENIAEMQNKYSSTTEDLHFNLFEFSAKIYSKENSHRSFSIGDIEIIIDYYRKMLDCITAPEMPRLTVAVEPWRMTCTQRRVTDRAEREAKEADKAEKSPQQARQFFAGLDRETLIDILEKGLKSPRLARLGRQFILAAGDELFERNEQGVA